MPIMIGRNRNTNDAVTVTGGIGLNSSTAVKLLDSNDTRVIYRVSNSSNQDVWIKEQAASVDNIKDGIFLPKNSVYESPTDNTYTGEISAISVSSSPTVNPSEY